MTRQIHVGSVPIGGGAPVVIQSMLNTKTTDIPGCLRQIGQLQSAGCQIVPKAASIPATSAGRIGSRLLWMCVKTRVSPSALA